jgi:hypothetical protein
VIRGPSQAKFSLVYILAYLVIIKSDKPKYQNQNKGRMTMLKTNGFAKSNLTASAHSTSFNPFNMSMGVNKEEFKDESNEEFEEHSTTNPEIEITDVINSFPQED